MIQLRERHLESSALFELASEILELTHGSPTRLVVNDRLDVALACAAHGVHLRGDSLPASAVRAIAPPPFQIGRSVHSPDEAAAAGEVDYLIAGTVWPTPSKSGERAWLGLSGLRAIVSASVAPVLAIGGVTLERAREARACGAAGVAAIGLFAAADGEGRSCSAKPLHDIVAALHEV